MISKLTSKYPPNIFNNIQVRTLSWPYHGMNIILHLIVSYDMDNFIAGRPKAALLFWFFGGFRCGVPLFIGMLVIY